MLLILSYTPLTLYVKLSFLFGDFHVVVMLFALPQKSCIGSRFKIISLRNLFCADSALPKSEDVNSHFLACFEPLLSFVLRDSTSSGQMFVRVEAIR